MVDSDASPASTGIGVQLVGAPLGRLVGIADDRLGEEEDLALVGVAPLLLHPSLERIVVLLHLVHRLPGHDDGLGVAGREVLAPVRSAGMDDEGTPLR
jgi:hypothetical protein